MFASFNIFQAPHVEIGALNSQLKRQQQHFLILFSGLLCFAVFAFGPDVHKRIRGFLRGGVKYYFADFVRKGGGDTPQIRNLFFGPKSGVF